MTSGSDGGSAGEDGKMDPDVPLNDIVKIWLVNEARNDQVYSMLSVMFSVMV